MPWFGSIQPWVSHAPNTKKLLALLPQVVRKSHIELDQISPAPWFVSAKVALVRLMHRNREIKPFTPRLNIQRFKIAADCKRNKLVEGIIYLCGV